MASRAVKFDNGTSRELKIISPQPVSGGDLPMVVARTLYMYKTPVNANKSLRARAPVNKSKPRVIVFVSFVRYLYYYPLFIIIITVCAVVYRLFFLHLRV